MSEVIIGSPQINQVVIEEDQNAVIIQSPITAIATIVAQGPQGPQGTAGSGIAVDDAAKVDKSVVYYDASSATFKADPIWTIPTLTDGGNF